MIDPLQAGIGIVVLLVVVGTLLAIFYSRTNAVSKTGYGALIMLALVSIMIPIFWIMESNGQAIAKADQHTLSVQRGALLYSTYCYACHGTKGQGRVGPKLNGNPSVDALTDSDLLRIINAGIYNTDTSKLGTPLMPAWSDRFGGPLSDYDIQYLFDLVRSADPAYLTKNGYTGDSAKNGFSQVANDIQTSAPTAYQTATAQESSGTFGNPVDMTKQKNVTIKIVPPPAGASCAPACFETLNAQVKVGTTITWINTDVAAHTVSAIKGTNVSTPIVDKTLFDSGVGTPIVTNAKFTYTVTKADYDANPNHTIIYYCQYHPGMLAELTIVP
ncbi:MAG TPA: c-type cytochrome [Ktedonobacteraceae bacterium]|nr:c-type cytochrome [Ktedonobacteraceae bacterium]